MRILFPFFETMLVFDYSISLMIGKYVQEIGARRKLTEIVIVKIESRKQQLSCCIEKLKILPFCWVC